MPDGDFRVKYPDEDFFLVVWLLDSPEDDYIHYIAVEFTSDNYDLFEMETTNNVKIDLLLFIKKKAKLQI